MASGLGNSAGLAEVMSAWQQGMQVQPGRGACSTTAVMGDAFPLPL